MKFLYSLIFAAFLTSQTVLSQENKYFNLVGSYTKKNCDGPSNGIGYVFANNICIDLEDSSWLFNVSSSGDNGEITEYVNGGEGCGYDLQPYSQNTYYNNKCQVTPTFSNESTLAITLYSIAQFANVPVYEPNSVVVASFDDHQCRELSSSVTFSNGLTVLLDDNSKQTYICKSGKPFIKICLNDGTHCTTKSAAVECSYQKSIFCAK